MRPRALASILILLPFIGYSQSAETYTNFSYSELDSLIGSHIQQGADAMAIPMAQAMVQKAMEDSSDSLRAEGLSRLGFLYRQTGDYDRALECLLECKSIDEKVLGAEHPFYANTLDNLAVLHEYMGNYDLALPLHLQARDIRKNSLGEEHPDYALSINNLAFLYKSMGNYSQSLPLYEQALEIFGKALGKEHPTYAGTLNNIAYSFQEMGLYDKALQLYLQALEIKESTLGKDHHDYAQALNNLGYLYETMGHYERALPLYLQTKEILLQTVGIEHPSYATLLNNLALLYEAMGDYDEALPLYLQTKEIDEKVVGKGHPYYASSVNNLAALYNAMGKHSQALPLFTEANAIDEKTLGRSHPNYATSLNNIGLTHDKMGNYSTALTYYLEAASIRELALGRQHPEYGKSLNNICELYGKINRFDQAWKALSDAIYSPSGLELAQTIDEEWLDRLATVPYASSAHLQEMLSSLRIAYDLLPKDPSVEDAQTKQIIVADLANVLLVRIRSEVSNEQDKLRILSQSHQWLQRSLQVLDPQTAAVKALTLTDQNKSVLLLQATKSEVAHRLGEVPDSLIWLERNLINDRSQLQARLLEQPTQDYKKALIDELNHLNRQIDEFVTMIKEDYPKYYQIKYQPTDANIQDLQSLIGPNTALLEYVVGDSAVHIFYLDQDEVEWYQCAISNSELKERIRSLHHSLNDYTSAEAYQEYVDQAYWFYQRLVAPAVASKEELTNLIIVPDGELGHLPFETFLVETGQDVQSPHYLIADYSISYSYSATLWKENMEAQAPKNNGQMLAVAADYNVALDTGLLTMRLPTDQWRRGELTELPAARKEVESLREKYAGFFAFDAMASEGMVKAKAPDYSILHFATHGFLDKDRPVLSSLAFTEDSDSGESNFWQAYEISKSQLNADLVVLSACETGYGKFETGNGIASLARAFMYAGAPSLVVSLWQVHDEATSDLMTRFYDHLDGGMKKDEALRQAKLDFIQSAQGITQHPAFWSPFIMMGKTDAVNIKKKGEVIPWVIGVGLLVVLVIGGVVARRRRR